jgi:hypothetical protein
VAITTKYVPTDTFWIQQIFRAKAARNGGIVRRKVESVKKYASLAQLRAEVRRRRFHMLQTGDQYLIICNDGFFKTIC